MYSGVVKHLGSVVERSAGHLKVESKLFEGVDPAAIVGNSYAIAGVCLSVTDCKAGAATFDISSETERRTTLGQLLVGNKVNLEKSLKVGDTLDGHFVMGHVDATASVISITKEKNDTIRFEFSLPKSVRALVAEKGSVAVDGISLTVGEVSPTSFSVYIIPITLQNTTLKDLVAGASVNIEADCLARYVARFHEVRAETLGQ